MFEKLEDSEVGVLLHRGAAQAAGDRSTPRAPISTA